MSHKSGSSIIRDDSETYEYKFYINIFQRVDIFDQFLLGSLLTQLQIVGTKL